LDLISVEQEIQRNVEKVRQRNECVKVGIYGIVFVPGIVDARNTQRIGNLLLREVAPVRNSFKFSPI
jgi:hypothetical protein